MLANFRNFEATDPFGRVWNVEFRWYQNAISIRHSDSINVKYYLKQDQEQLEIAVALPHPALIGLARKTNRKLTDAWTLKLASLFLFDAIEAWDGMDQTILTPALEELEPLASALARDEAERAAEVR